MKYSEIETPQKLIEDMCGDWDWRAPVEEKAEHLEGIQVLVHLLNNQIPNSHLKEYLGELHEELGHKINSYSEI